jgi:hypothetical protein
MLDARAWRVGVVSMAAALVTALLSGTTATAMAAARTAGSPRSASAAPSGCAAAEAYEPPGVPGQPSAVDQGPDSVTLVWAPSAVGSCPVARYMVFASASGGPPVSVATATTTFVTVTAASAAVYSYSVMAVDTEGVSSAASASVSVNFTVPPPAVDPLCRVSYTATQWPGGFWTSVTITNDDGMAAPLAGWTLTFPFGGDQRITTAWNAVVTQDGQQVTASSEPYNAVLPNGGSVTFGFTGTWTASDAPPGPATLTSPQFFLGFCG